MESDSTKNQIISVAETLFALKGYDGTGIQEIVSKAGITKPTLYYYFGSKAGLFQEIVKTKGNELAEKILKATESTDFFEGLSNIFNIVTEFSKNNLNYFRIHCSMMNAPENSEAFQLYDETLQKLYEIIFQYFVKSSEVFGNMKGKEKLYSSLFFNNISFVALKISADKTPIDKEFTYTLIHSFIYGFAD